jgi:hypothetical protein
MESEGRGGLSAMLLAMVTAIGILLSGLVQHRPAASEGPGEKQRGEASNLHDEIKTSPATAAALSEGGSVDEPKRGSLAEFLQSRFGDCSSAGTPPVTFLIATLPDPDRSGLVYIYERNREAIQRALEALGYGLEAEFLPWPHREAAHPEDTPGVILYRHRRFNDMVAVLAIGETATAGIHRKALAAALDGVSSDVSCPLCSLRGPSCSKADISKVPRACPQHVRILGPTFSGSANSLESTLETWNLGCGLAVPSYRVVSGTATAVTPARDGILDRSYRATVLPDTTVITAMAELLHEQDAQPEDVAILHEANTTFGREVSAEASSWLSIPFPLHIHRIAEAHQQATADDADTLWPRRKVLPLPDQDKGNPGNFFDSPSGTELTSRDLVLTNILETLMRERIRYVGLFATDVLDRLFLAREIRSHCPDTRLITFGADVLYEYPAYRADVEGMTILTTYPLFSMNQLWTPPHVGDTQRLEFPSATAQGVYNATLALMLPDIVGTVSFPPNSRISQATVTLQSTDPARSGTLAVRTQIKDRGVYRFEGIQPGPYGISIDADGLASFRGQLFRLPGSTAEVNVQLEYHSSRVTPESSRALPRLTEYAKPFARAPLDKIAPPVWVMAAGWNGLWPVAVRDHAWTRHAQIGDIAYEPTHHPPLRWPSGLMFEIAFSVVVVVALLFWSALGGRSLVRRRQESIALLQPILSLLQRPGFSSQPASLPPECVRPRLTMQFAVWSTLYGMTLTCMLTFVAPGILSWLVSPFREWYRDHGLSLMRTDLLSRAAAYLGMVIFPIFIILGAWRQCDLAWVLWKAVRSSPVPPWAARANTTMARNVRLFLARWAHSERHKATGTAAGKRLARWVRRQVALDDVARRLEREWNAAVRVWYLIVTTSGFLFWPFLVFAIALPHLFPGGNAGLGLMFALLRTRALDSGLSPLLPMLFIGTAAITLALYNLARCRMVEQIRQPESFVEHFATGPIRNLEIMVRDMVKRPAVMLPGFWVVATILVVMMILEFRGTTVPGVDGLRYDNVFAAGAVFLYIGLMVSYARFVGVWVIFRRLLGTAADQWFAAGFKRWGRDAAREGEEARRGDPNGAVVALVNLGQVLVGRDVVRALSTQELLTRARTDHTIALEKLTDGDHDSAIIARARVQASLCEFGRRYSPHTESGASSLREGDDIDAAAEFAAGCMTLFIQPVMGQLRRLVSFVTIGLMLLLAAVTSYPFGGKQSILTLCWGMVVLLVPVSFVVFLQMEKDPVLSMLSGTEAGRVTWSRQLFGRVGAHVVVPLLGIFGAQWSRGFGSIVRALLGGA